MRFLYVAPRYHTNQIPIMKGLTEHGHEVCFISHYQGKIEDYSYVTPIVAGYAPIFRLFDSFYVKCLRKNHRNAVNMKLKLGFPSMHKIKGLVKEFDPDVMIIRERSVYSIFAAMACRGLGIPMILYNQSPLWEEKIKNDLPHRIVKGLLPKVRITPVLGEKKEGNVREDRAFFVPFVMEPRLQAEKKQWFRNNRIHILCVGKYEERKNGYMLLQVFNELCEKYPLHLTIAGECSNDFHRAYQEKLRSYIEEQHLGDKVILLENLSRNEMDHLYKEADLFVLPSTAEPASISQLEAMAFSVPVICGDKNGTACYVRHEETGYLFRDNNRESLKEMIERAASDRRKLQEMGKRGYDVIDKECSFEGYYESICSCVKVIKCDGKRK